MMEEIDLSDEMVDLKNEDSFLQKELEPPDPRIQIELERLNTCTDLINKVEVDLDEGRMLFRQLLSESTQSINTLGKKLGKCIEQARPYYDARIRSKQSMNEAQKSAIRFERAMSQHSAAREMVHLAEEGLISHGCKFDSTWQEMLNHATTKVNNAEKEKNESANEHREKSMKYHEADLQVKYLQKELKRSISKSRPYFEMKAVINQRLEEQKRRIKELEEAVAMAKSTYSQTLANLETISDQIHKTRENKSDMGIRRVGVGAESITPPVNEFINLSSPTQQKNCATNEVNQTKEDKLLKSLSPSPPQHICQWQFLPPPSSASVNFLYADDKESILSDAESLTSMEMLSEEAISNLMLEEEFEKLSNNFCGPLLKEKSNYASHEYFNEYGHRKDLSCSNEACDASTSSVSSPNIVTNYSIYENNLIEITKNLAINNNNTAQKYQAAAVNCISSSAEKGSSLEEFLAGNGHNESSEIIPQRPNHLPLTFIQKSDSCSSESSQVDTPCYIPLSNTPDHFGSQVDI